MDFSKEVKLVNKKELFKIFLSGYRSKRLLSDLEEQALQHIYPLSEALWFTKIVYKETALCYLLEKDDMNQVENLFKEILQVLEEDYFFQF